MIYGFWMSHCFRRISRRIYVQKISITYRVCLRCDWNRCPRPCVSLPDALERRADVAVPLLAAVWMVVAMSRYCRRAVVRELERP